MDKKDLLKPRDRRPVPTTADLNKTIKTKRTPVISSCISSIGYSDKERVLEVEFYTGTIYHYYNVPPHEYRSIMNSPSKGGFLKQYIEKRYKYKRVL